jgi:hypothetical integral membrane protein (TIGR02206 family)
MSAGSQYWIAVALGAALCLAACLVARRYPGRPARDVGRAISALLVADAVTFVLRPVVEGNWTARGSLPLDLCDVALGIAAIACWYPRWQFGVELTYFWGLAGTLQGVLTPDLSASFPDLQFFEFVAGHVGIVIAALYLVVGLRLEPRSGSVAKVFVFTAAYTALVGLFDWLADANYMYLARIPRRTSLLSVLGPWPWYLVSAAGVAVVLFLILDAPFRHKSGNRGARS